jgi:hypothetical protein
MRIMRQRVTVKKVAKPFVNFRPPLNQLVSQSPLRKGMKA